MCAHRLSGGSELPPQEQERGDSQHDKDDHQRHDVEREVGVQHVQLLERGGRRLEVTVHLVALELFATVRVRGEGGSLESVPDVGQVGDPPQVNWNGVERNEEAGEQQEWDRHDRREEHTVLDVHGCAHDQTDTLSDERNEQTRAKEHCEPEPLHRLGREVVHD